MDVLLAAFDKWEAESSELNGLQITIPTPSKPMTSSGGDGTGRACFVNNLYSAAKEQVNIWKRYIASQ